LLLPAGFLAGVATDDVHPDKLLGSLYQPFVSIAVGVILFEAGLRLSIGEVAPTVRKAVVRLVVGGALLTWLAITATVLLLYDDIERGAAFLIGAILVVSGPTVVLPLLAFIRPTRDVRSLLKWEGTLVDPIGALLGVLVFAGVSSGKGWQPGAMLIDLGVGALVAVVGAPALWLLLREVHRHGPRMVVPATLMVVVAAIVAADLIREDSGLLAAVLMGILVSNQRGIDISLSLYEFEETLVQLLIGVLFVLVAASVSLDEVRSVLPQALVLVAVMILVIRPAAVALATWRLSFTRHERAFVAWRRHGASSRGRRRRRSVRSWRRTALPARTRSSRSYSSRSSVPSWSTASPLHPPPGCSGWPDRVADWCSSSAAIRGRARSRRP
jgi:NhaP-type Na+/H+ or K+/H+ antiporter